MVEFPEREVHTKSVRWEDQKFDLTSAGRLARDADSSGFSSAAVRTRASSFGDSWGGHLDEIGVRAGRTSVALADAVTTWFRTDASVGEQRGFARWKATNS